MLSRTLLELTTRRAWRRLQEQRRNCERIQTDYFRTLLRTARDTAFGRHHRLDRVRTPDAFREIPIHDFEAHRPWIERMAAGEANVLWPGRPLLFNLTSGTTAEPKYVPFTREAARNGALLVRLWMLLAARDNPRAFAGAKLLIPGRAVEGLTAGGIPYGSASGQVYRDAPIYLRSGYAVPYPVFDIPDHETRTLLLLRHALTRDVRFILTASPMTIVRLAGAAEENAELLIRSIHDGGGLAALGCARMRAGADPARARNLERLREGHGALRLADVWPNLSLIACWLGGSVGAHAPKLKALFPNVPLRDPGFHASEARMSIPYTNESPAGMLAVEHNFYEFQPAGETTAPTLLAHQLEAGRQYRVIVSNFTGLLRYDMNDLIVVRDFFGDIPVIEFVRKGGDISNLLGEKLHINHCLLAYRELAAWIGASDDHFFLTASAADRRYTLHLEFAGPPPAARAAEIAVRFDAELRRVNLEYDAKRRSGRLEPLDLKIVPGGGMEAQMRADFRAGAREAQYKWKIFRETENPAFSPAGV